MPVGRRIPSLADPRVLEICPCIRSSLAKASGLQHRDQCPVVLLAQVEQREVRIATESERSSERGFGFHGLLTQSEHCHPEAVSSEGEEAPFNGEMAPATLLIDGGRLAINLNLPARHLEGGDDRPGWPH